MAAIAFIVASEILLRMLRAARDLPSAGKAAETVAVVTPTAPATVFETVADAVPGETAANGPSVPDRGPVHVPAHVPVAVPQVARVAPVRARGHARPRSPRQPIPERVFAAEIERGELPSLRTIKARMHVGTDRARVVRTSSPRSCGEFLKQPNQAEQMAPADKGRAISLPSEAHIGHRLPAQYRHCLWSRGDRHLIMMIILPVRPEHGSRSTSSLPLRAGRSRARKPEPQRRSRGGGP